MRLLERINPIAAIADQAWLALLNLGVAAALISTGSKTEYGIYLLLVPPLLLVQSIQNAGRQLTTSHIPSSCVSCRERSDQRHGHFIERVPCADMCGVRLGRLLVYLDLAHVRLQFLLIIGFPIAMIGAIARESQRNFAYVMGEGVLALRSDAIYGAILIIGLGLVISRFELSAGIVMLLMGIAGAGFAAAGKIPTVSRTADACRIHKEVLVICGRWAVPSVLVTWINLSSYPYFAGKSLGLSGVADIGVARLFLMPLGLLVAAWANWYRPRISAWLGAGNVSAVRQLTFRSVLVGLGAMSVIARHWYSPIHWPKES